MARENTHMNLSLKALTCLFNPFAERNSSKSDRHRLGLGPVRFSTRLHPLLEHDSFPSSLFGVRC